MRNGIQKCQILEENAKIHAKNFNITSTKHCLSEKGIWAQSVSNVTLEANSESIIKVKIDKNPPNSITMGTCEASWELTPDIIVGKSIAEFSSTNNEANVRICKISDGVVEIASGDQNTKFQEVKIMNNRVDKKHASFDETLVIVLQESKMKSKRSFSSSNMFSHKEPEAFLKQQMPFTVSKLN